MTDSIVSTKRQSPPLTARVTTSIDPGDHHLLVLDESWFPAKSVGYLLVRPRLRIRLIGPTGFSAPPLDQIGSRVSGVEA